MSEIEHDRRYVRGVEYFNECEYFEAHDVWEELWQEYTGEDRTFLQGLIQAAVCLHHFANGNTRGAVKLYHSSRRYLEPFAPRHCRLDVARFLDQMTDCCRDIIGSEETYPSGEIPEDRLPEIELLGADAS